MFFYTCTSFSCSVHFCFFVECFTIPIYLHVFARAPALSTPADAPLSPTFLEYTCTYSFQQIRKIFDYTVLSRLSWSRITQRYPYIYLTTITAYMTLSTDYTLVNFSRTLTSIENPECVEIVFINTIDDSLVEGNETFSLSLTSSSFIVDISDSLLLVVIQIDDRMSLYICFHWLFNTHYSLLYFDAIQPIQSAHISISWQLKTAVILSPQA